MIYVVDSSVVLAAMLGEAGGEELLGADRGSEICAVNVSEVFATLTDGGLALAEVELQFSRFELRVRTFREGHAMRVGALRPLTREFGQSLGDRACLMQAEFSGLPILTADRRMAETGAALGLEVRLIR